MTARPYAEPDARYCDAPLAGTDACPGVAGPCFCYLDAGHPGRHECGFAATNDHQED